MSQVDFYILSDAARDAVHRQACKLINESWQQDSIYVHLAAEAEVQAFDRLLWTWQQDSFIPHQALDGTGIPKAPVLLGSGDIPDVACRVLINLSLQLPPQCRRFDRILEIIAVQDELRAAGRQRFKAYREQGHALESHNL